jgi:hypothetical protein
VKGSNIFHIYKFMRKQACSSRQEDNELEVARNFTWAVLGMEGGNF